MRLYNLSASDASPCIVLRFKSCTLMLDCPLDFTPAYNFLPHTHIARTRIDNLHSKSIKDQNGKVVSTSELKENAGTIFVDSMPEFSIPETEMLDLRSVDAILISNSSSMLALPYITEYCGFDGTIYVTEPAHQMGRLLMEELFEYCHRVSTSKSATKWKEQQFRKHLPSSLVQCLEHGNAESWKHCYSLDDLHSSLSRVHQVSYGENFSVFGALNVAAHSSGYHLGSCNWVISSDYEKIVYLSATSSLTTHPQPFDPKFLTNSDLLIYTGLTQAPTHNPDNTLAEFCSCLAKTLKNSGNILIPCLPTGLIYDLLECLLNYMESSNLINIPIYLISPSAKASLCLSQIYAEWLHPKRQNKAYLPEVPFSHEDLIELGRLKVVPHIHDRTLSNFKKPCVVLAGHPSLRFGDAIPFVEMWRNNVANSIIFVEPNFPYMEALSPFQPMSARTFYFPIDTRTNHQAASRIINDLKPGHLVVPASYIKPPLTAPHRTDLKLTTECTPTILERKSTLQLKIKRNLEKVYLEPELSASLSPIEIKPGVLFAPISAQISTRDNKHTLKAINKRPISRKRKLHEDIHRPVLNGNLNEQAVVESLIKGGFANAKLEESSAGKIIILQDAVIQMDKFSTHIVCEGSPVLREKLRDILLKNLRR